MNELPRIGSEFAGYRIKGLVGRGGMSVVYLADHPRLNRTVALKIIAPELAEEDVFRERFVRESRIAASLDHPNIVPIYDTGDEDGLLYIVMRHIKSDLRSLIRQERRLPPPRSVNIVAQVAGALDAGHKLGLVHRDVKPANILVQVDFESNEQDYAYLTDFGLTKHLTSRSGLTGTGQFVGTVNYMAPEQIEGKLADGRADVYALTCVVFECLTGHVPFDGETDASVMRAHLQEPPPRITRIEENLPSAVDDVIARGLAKSQDDRYSTCGALVGALGDALAREPERQEDESSVLSGETVARPRPDLRPVPDIPATPSPQERPAREPQELQPREPHPQELQPRELQAQRMQRQEQERQDIPRRDLRDSVWNEPKKSVEPTVEPIGAPASASVAESAADEPETPRPRGGLLPTVLILALAFFLGAGGATAAVRLLASRQEAATGGATAEEGSGVDPETANLLPPATFHCEDAPLDAFQNANPRISLAVVATEAYACSPEGAPRGLKTLYTQFVDASGDRRFIDAQARQLGIPIGDDCRDDGRGYQHWFSDEIDGSHTIGPRRQSAIANGRVLCYQTPDGRYWIEWIDPGAKAVYGQASLEDPNRLFAWWADGGGPVHR